MWGTEVLEAIRRDCFLPESRLYSEAAGADQPSFNWGAGVMLSALNAAARFEEKYKVWLREYADATRAYWNGQGYDVLPGPKRSDLYYDDNAWMALALVETHEVLGDSKYLEWAKEALAFSLKGEAVSGGMFWRESDKASRNACSCGPTAAACLAVSRHTGSEGLPAKAREIVEWTRRHLEDPSDGLYWDSVTNEGELDATKWSYNSGLMIRARRGLGDEGWRRTFDSSKTRWMREGRIQDPGRFAHLLLERWIEVEGPRPEFVEALAKVWAARSSQGFVPPHWGKDEVPKNPELLDQAGFVRACFALAVQQRKHEPLRGPHWEKLMGLEGVLSVQDQPRP